MADVVISEPVIARWGTLALIAFTSEHEGERQSARSALDRDLKAKGLSFHDLTDRLLTTAPPPPPPQRSEPPAPPKPESPLRPSAQGWGDWECDADELLKRVLKILASYSPAPGSFDDRFLADMKEKTFKFDTIVLSQKQLETINRLLRRARS